MVSTVITKKQDFTHLSWTQVRSSSGTAGNFLKAQETVGGEKLYYKLSAYDSEKGIVGHECVNEIIVGRLLDLLGVEHLTYQLIHADITLDGRVCETWLCASKDFKKRGETKAALDSCYQINKSEGESRYDFCRSRGWQRYIDTMLAVDYLILNRDRHGANIEVLRNARARTLRIAPLFDHGLSLLCSCYTEQEIATFDVETDRPCNNFIGSRSTWENLSYIQDKAGVFSGRLTESDRDSLFADLGQLLSETHQEKIWEMIWTRWCRYENLCHKG